jgi:hypothetical protein
MIPLGIQGTGGGRGFQRPDCKVTLIQSILSPQFFQSLADAPDPVALLMHQSTNTGQVNRSFGEQSGNAKHRHEVRIIGQIKLNALQIRGIDSVSGTSCFDFYSHTLQD